MLKKSTMLAAATVGLVGLGASTVHAAPPTEDKKWELTLIGSGSSDKKFDNNEFDATVGVGYFFTNQHEVAVRQDLGFTNDSGDNNFVGSTTLAYDFHFDFGQDQRIIPFAGVSIGYLYGEDVDESFTAGIEGGVKWYVNDTTFIYGSIAYQWIFEHGGDADDTFDDGNWAYGVGIGFRF